MLLIPAEAVIGVAVAAALLTTTFHRATEAGTRQVLDLRVIIEDPDPGKATDLLQRGLWSVLTSLGPLLAAVVVTALAVAVAQGGLHRRRFRLETQQWNPVAGVRRMFGPQAWWNGAKALLKTAVIGVVLYAVVRSFVPVLLQAGGLTLGGVVAAAGSGILTLLLWAVGAGLALSALDVWVVVRRNRRHTRMSKKELKDEHKNTDGDPLVRSQRRSRQLALTRNRMIADVASARVVVVNPTHVAVALRYEPGRSAPTVVAKGVDHLAARIRDAAVEARVPLVRDVTLARVLNRYCPLGQEIPAELYLAVARVLAFVMALQQRGTSFGSAVPYRMPGEAIQPGEWDRPVD